MNHWQVIEDALESERIALAAFDMPVDELDAALAFVREMREGQWIRKPLPVITQPDFVIDLDDDAPQPDS